MSYLSVLLLLVLSGCASRPPAQANWKLVYDTDEFYTWACYVDQNKPVGLKHAPPFNDSNMFDAQCFRYLKVKP